KERVHFLIDYVGALADTTREQIGELEDRQSDLAIAIAVEQLCERCFKVAPDRRLRRQDIVHATNGLQGLAQLGSLSAAHDQRGIGLSLLAGLATNELFQLVNQIVVAQLLRRLAVDVDEIVRRAARKANVGFLGLPRAV